MAKQLFSASSAKTSVALCSVPEGETEVDANNPLDLVGPEFPDGATEETIMKATHEFSDKTGMSVVLSGAQKNGRLCGCPVRADIFSDQMRKGKTYLIPTSIGTGAIYRSVKGGFAGATVVFLKGHPILEIEDKLRSLKKDMEVDEDMLGSSARTMAVLMAARSVLVTYRLLQLISPPEKVLIEVRIVKKDDDIEARFGVLMEKDKPARRLGESERSIIEAHRHEAANGIFVLDATNGEFLFLNLVSQNVIQLLRGQKEAQMPVPTGKPAHVMSARVDAVMSHHASLSPETRAFFKRVLSAH